jgi:hypothetical protein
MRWHSGRLGRRFARSGVAKVGGCWIVKYFSKLARDGAAVNEVSGEASESRRSPEMAGIYGPNADFAGILDDCWTEVHNTKRWG